MDAYGYISVIISVVIGLGLSHLLTGMAELVKSRRRVKFYRVHLIWVGLTFVGHIFLWWTMWNLRLVRDGISFRSFRFYSRPYSCTLPPPFSYQELNQMFRSDLREYFYENYSAFFGVTAAFTALMSAQNWLLTGRVSPAPVMIVFAVWFALLCASAIIKNQRYHAATALLFILLFLLFVSRFGLRLGGM